MEEECIGRQGPQRTVELEEEEENNNNFLTLFA
jgi:hypothetical protein